MVPQRAAVNTYSLITGAILSLDPKLLYTWLMSDITIPILKRGKVGPTEMKKTLSKRAHRVSGGSQNLNQATLQQKSHSLSHASTPQAHLSNCRAYLNQVTN